jgi:hypothetical protein
VTFCYMTGGRLKVESSSSVSFKIYLEGRVLQQVYWFTKEGFYVTLADTCESVVSYFMESRSVVQSLLSEM